MKRTLIFISLFILAAGLIYGAEKYKVSGRVYDNTTKAPVEGVNVIIRGTDNGDATDSEGYFEIPKIESGDYYMLVFSHIQYKKIVRALDADETADIELAIYLDSTQIELPQIAVEGKKTFADIRATYTIGGDEFERLNYDNLEDALEYLMPDVVKPMSARLAIPRDGMKGYTAESIKRMGENDFTLYINGVWVETMHLDELNPYKIQYVKVWKARQPVHTNDGIRNMEPFANMPKGLPLHEGNSVVLVVTEEEVK